MIYYQDFVLQNMFFFLNKKRYESFFIALLRVPYIRRTEFELLLIKTQSVVQPLHTEVEEVGSFEHHRCNGFCTELFRLEIIYP